MLSDQSRETQTARVLNRMDVNCSCIRAKGNSEGDTGFLVLPQCHPPRVASTYQFQVTVTAQGKSCRLSSRKEEKASQWAPSFPSRGQAESQKLKLYISLLQPSYWPVKLKVIFLKWITLIYFQPNWLGKIKQYTNYKYHEKSYSYLKDMEAYVNNILSINQAT